MLIVDMKMAMDLFSVGFPQPQQGYTGETCTHPLGMIISRPTVKEGIDYLKNSLKVYISTEKNNWGYSWRYYSVDKKSGKQSFVVGCRKNKATKTEEEALLNGLNYLFRNIESN